MKMRKSYRIIIVDDHPVVRNGLKTILELDDELSVCGEAPDATEAIRLIHQERPNLAIVDINLKGSTSGIELIEAISKRFTGISCIVISIETGTLVAERALKAGARGYVVKDEAPESILEAVKAVLKGDIYISRIISEKLVTKHVMQQHTHGDDGIELLSNRELEIFRLIGQGYKRKEIARLLNISVNTLESHRRKIKEKLNVKTSSELARAAVQWLLSFTD